MHKSIIVAAALTIGLMSSPIAFADATGRLVFGSVSYTLTDLDLDDGIAPLLVFQPVPTSGYGAIANLHAGVDADDHSQGSGVAYDLIGPQRVSSSVPGMGYAVTEMRGRDHPITHVVEISLDLTEGSSSAWNRHVNGSAMTDLLYFELSPNTAVSFSLEMEVDITRLGASNAPMLYRMWATLLMAAPSYADAQVAELKLTGRVPAGEDFSLDEQHVLSLDYENRSGANQTGYLVLMGQAALHANPGLVPEPSIASMLAAGLLGAGIWSHRTRRKSLA